MTEQEKRDKDFRFLCKWFHDAEKVRDIIENEVPNWNDLVWDDEQWNRCKAFRSVNGMLEFLSNLSDFPQDFAGVPEDQRDDYPDLAYGLMTVALWVGQMRENDRMEFGQI